MNDPLRKYVTEFSLNMNCTFHALIQQDALTNPDHVKMLESASPFHIYMICSRPRIALKPASLSFENNAFSGTYTIQKGMNLEEKTFSTPHSHPAHEFTIECEFPHTEFEMKHSSRGRIMGGKVAIAMSLLCRDEPAFDLEVLYVGQSYGEEGSSVALDRLQTHSTLQNIYADAMRRSPDKDIWIVLLAFEPVMLTSFDSRKPVSTTLEEDSEHMRNVLRKGITEHQRINFTEAALIRYFQPPYNVIFKESFPNPAHKTYAECYDLDLNAVNVEVSTEEFHCRLWSQSIPPDWDHLITYELHSKEERKSMFDFAF